MNFETPKYYGKLKRCAAMILLLGLSFTAQTGQVYAAPNNGNAAAETEEEIAQASLYIVSQDGMGDFTTIQAGVDAVQSGDTLLICPGVYEESVEVLNKTVNLVGWDRDTCVIRYNASGYAKAPLIFSAGDVENLTIYGYGGETQEQESVIALTEIYGNENSTVDEIAQWQSMFSGYAVHIDSNYLYGKNVHMKNCKIISDNNCCVGIGGRGESSVALEQCELVANGTGGCIYYHNTDEEAFGGEAYFTLRDCVLKNYRCPYVISMHSTGECNRVYLTFQNTHVSTVAYEARHIYNLTNMNTMFDVELMEKLEKSDALYTVGYSTSLKKSGLITHYDINKSYEYMEMIDNAPKDRQALQLPEGISYISFADNEPHYIEQESRPDVKARKRCVIDIYNKNQVTGSGWCGLNDIYLMPESYGNTLIEMNYPIMN